MTLEQAIDKLKSSQRGMGVRNPDDYAVFISVSEALAIADMLEAFQTIKKTVEQGASAALDW